MGGCRWNQFGHQSSNSLGLKTRPGDDFAEFEIMPDDERRWHPLIGDFYPRKNVPHICIANVGKVRDATWFVATMSSARQGPIQAPERRRFRATARAVSPALSAAAAIKDDGARLLAGAFNALSVTAFVCDVFGRVIALSAGAESLARRETLLRLQGGGLAAKMPTQTAALERAILCAARHRPGAAPDLRSNIPLSDSSGGVVASAQAIPLPRDRCDIGLGAAALLIVDERPKRDLSVIAARFGLTKAEAEIAECLLQRLHIDEIAARREVSEETVRTQAKAVYLKASVSGQRELIARFGGK